MRQKRHTSRRRLITLLSTIALLSWAPVTWAAVNCSPMNTSFILPSFGTVIVPPNAAAGTPIGPQEIVALSFNCTGVPGNKTVSIVASNLGALDNFQGAANSIVLKTTVTGVGLELTANPLPTYDQGNNTVTFADTMSASNPTISETVIGRLIKTQAGAVQAGPVNSAGGWLIGAFTAVPSNGAGGSINLNSKLILQGSAIISAPACTATVQPVVLPTVSTSALGNGQTAGTTAFSIILTNCPSGVNTTAAFFEPSASIDSATGNLINSGTAANIQVRLLNGAGGNAIAGSPINLGAPDKMQNSGQYGITGGAATMNYYAQYVANGGAAGAGNVNTSVKFTLEYP